MRTEYGTRAEEFTRAIESGPPYLVRYHWAGGAEWRAQEIVTEAIAACFGLKALEHVQVIREAPEAPEPLSERVRYAFWLLRTFDLSLGFTHGRVKPAAERPSPSPTDGPGSTDDAYEIVIRVDRARYRLYYEEA